MRHPEGTMTVKDLRKALRSLPDDAPVLVPGYEDGYEYAAAPVIATMAFEEGSPGWSGQWQELDLPDYTTRSIARVVVLTATRGES